jgi:cell division protein FtsQ
MSALAAARRLRPVKLRGVRAALVPGPRLRRRVVALGVLALLLTAFYMLWLRDSGLVAVERVEVTGLTGRDADRVRTALDGAARGMTTLHVDQEALENAAAVFPVVQAIEVEADFPSGLKINVIEHRPVALLVSGERRIPVAADGTVLAGLPTEGSLPVIETEAAIPARQLEPGVALDAARVAGGAPAVLVGRLAQVERESDRGLVVGIEDGPDLIFGGTDRLAAKWAAAVRVLADPDAAGAEYVDVRLPERPAAGGLAVETVAPVAPAGTELPEVVPVVPEADPALSVEPAPVVPEALPQTEYAPGAVEPAPAPVAPPSEAPVDPGGGAVAEPQP